MSENYLPSTVAGGIAFDKSTVIQYIPKLAGFVRYWSKHLSVIDKLLDTRSLYKNTIDSVISESEYLAKHVCAATD